MNIYSEEEIDEVEDGELQKLAQEIKQRFDQRRAFFHQRRHKIIDQQQWNEFNKLLVTFDQDDFNSWNREWRNIVRSTNKEQLKQFFSKGVDIYAPIEDYLEKNTYSEGHSPDVELLKSEVLTNIESDLLDLKNDVLTKVDSGIKSVLDLKAELGLEKNFSEKISGEIESSNKLKNRFMKAFIITALLIPVFLICTYLIDSISGLEKVELYFLRFGLSISLGVIALFSYSQYRLYQLVNLRYSHLHGFLGGGATFISQIIGTDQPELKNEINKKLAVLFMELEDIFSLASKTKHPSEKLVEQFESVVKTALKK